MKFKFILNLLHNNLLQRLIEVNLKLNHQKFDFLK